REALVVLLGERIAPVVVLIEDAELQRPTRHRSLPVILSLAAWPRLKSALKAQPGARPRPAQLPRPVSTGSQVSIWQADEIAQTGKTSSIPCAMACRN